MAHICSKGHRNLKEIFENLVRTRQPLLTYLCAMALGLVAMPLLATSRVTIQFFGDFYLPSHVIKLNPPNSPLFFFSGLTALLAESEFNILNLEGPITHVSETKTQDKTHVHKMPRSVGAMLKSASIDGVTLANNHIMDYGERGLRDTLGVLAQNQIIAVGAATTETSAMRPAIFATEVGALCVFSISRTYPSNFAAKKERPGTAMPTYDALKEMIKSSDEQCAHIIFAFHWGEEGSHEPKPYQRDLARMVIKAGADAVIGHHPHVLQSVEFFQGRPIVYSIGNMIFATAPARRIGHREKTANQTGHEGLAVRFEFEKGAGLTETRLTPLDVGDASDKFVSTVLNDPSIDPIADLLLSPHPCKKEGRHWICRPTK